MTRFEAYGLFCLRPDCGLSMLHSDCDAETAPAFCTALVSLSGMLDDAETQDDLDDAIEHALTLIRIGIVKNEQLQFEVLEILAEVERWGEQAVTEIDRKKTETKKTRDDSFVNKRRRKLIVDLLEAQKSGRLKTPPCPVIDKSTGRLIDVGAAFVLALAEENNPRLMEGTARSIESLMDWDVKRACLALNKHERTEYDTSIDEMRQRIADIVQIATDAGHTFPPLTKDTNEQ